MHLDLAQTWTMFVINGPFWNSHDLILSLRTTSTLVRLPPKEAEAVVKIGIFSLDPMDRAIPNKATGGV